MTFKKAKSGLFKLFAIIIIVWPFGHYLAFSECRSTVIRIAYLKACFRQIGTKLKIFNKILKFAFLVLANLAFFENADGQIWPF